MQCPDAVDIRSLGHSAACLLHVLCSPREVLSSDFQIQLNSVVFFLCCLGSSADVVFFFHGYGAAVERPGDAEGEGEGEGQIACVRGHGSAECCSFWQVREKEKEKVKRAMRTRTSLRHFHVTFSHISSICSYFHD